MLISITLITFSGLLLGFLCKKVKFPALFGMILAGILIGPQVLNLLDPGILNISAEIRKIALIIILIRAGLKLSFDDLKKVGRRSQCEKFHRHFGIHRDRYRCRPSRRPPSDHIFSEVSHA